MSSHDPSRMDKKTDSWFKYPNKEKAKPGEKKRIIDSQIHITDCRTLPLHVAEHRIPPLYVTDRHIHVPRPIEVIFGPNHATEFTSDLKLTDELCHERVTTNLKYKNKIHSCTKCARPLSPHTITCPISSCNSARESYVPLRPFFADRRTSQTQNMQHHSFECGDLATVGYKPITSPSTSVVSHTERHEASQTQNIQHHSFEYEESIREKSATVGYNPITSPSTSVVYKTERHEARLLTAIMTDNHKAIDKVLMTFEVIPLRTINTCIRISLERHNRHYASTFLSLATKQLRAMIGNDVWDVWPAYEVGDNWVPVFVVLLRTNVQCEWGEFLGFKVFRRRYDFVSPEAAMVMNSDGVRNDMKEEVSEIDMIRRVSHCEVDRLIKKHSNITIVNVCPVRSKNGGRQLVNEPCFVIHCLVKGLVPFDENPFPRSISGFPTDVREGYMMMGMNPGMNGVSSIAESSRSDARGPLLKGNHSDFQTLCKQMSTFGLADIGNKSTDYNPDLLMGTGISREKNPMTGTLGGFVYLPDGEMGFLTCAHVVGEHVGQQVVQPSHGEMPTSSSVCGRVEKSIFQPGSCDETGVDAAVVKISDRRPRDGNFIWVSPESQTAAGFPSTQTVRYCGGKILTRKQLEEYRRNDVIKIGSQSGLTRGSLYLNGVYVRTNNREMVLPDEKKVEFFNQMEIQSHYGSKAFFELGDSGALVFMPLKNNELHCIGLAIGKTSYLSCIVTPIDEVLRRLELNPQFVNFGVANGFQHVNGFHL